MSKKVDPPTRGRTQPLPSKLTPPTLPKIVLRARLFRELDRARTRPIIWIAAPPGAGKTTLVASYLNARRLRPLWYTVDERDGDLATFFHYLSLSARPLAPGKSPPLPHLTPEYLQGVSVFTRNVFEALDAQLPRSVALVLDNYQTIPADSPVHEMLALGFSHLAVERPVLIISREEPPLPRRHWSKPPPPSMGGWPGWSCCWKRPPVPGLCRRATNNPATRFSTISAQKSLRTWM